MQSINKTQEQMAAVAVVIPIAAATVITGAATREANPIANVMIVVARSRSIFPLTSP